MNDGDNNNLNDGQNTVEIRCHARMLGLSKLVECNTNVHSCRWHFPFGEGLLCAHPSNAMIAKGVVQTGWSVN